MSELERTVEYLKDRARHHRKAIFWILFGLGMLWLMIAVKEVTALLLLSYAFALLLDPLVDRMELRGLTRSNAILLLCLVAVLVVVTIFTFAVPKVLQEYGRLVALLPGYLETAASNVSGFLQSSFGVHVPMTSEEILIQLREWSGYVGLDHLRRIGWAALQTVLSGYSLTLTILNLTLLPFFVYYVACDLDNLHRSIGAFLPHYVRVRAEPLGNEILGHVYAFFRGQLTVSVIMAVLYMIGLLIVGLPYAIIVGLLSGLLNIVPYLGLALGLLLASLITLVTEPAWSQLLLVWGVFGVVQFIEGTFLTPRIVGESVGIHPLAAMLALIVGGQLFGLVGLILAIPGAAAVRVLVRHALEELDSMHEVQSDLITTA